MTIESLNEKPKNTQLQRVQKFIALSGYCSRRKAEELIEQKKVTVNDKLISLGDMCCDKDTIKINGKKIQFNIDDKIYIILNKKKGYVTTKSDELNRKTIYNLLDKKDNKKNLFSVGRLDKETSGLIILTNDGDIAQKIIHPSSKIAKEYIGTLNHPLDGKDKISIEKGLILDDIKLSPCKIRRLCQKKYLIKIYEGRKRQIRRMFEQKSYKVTDLKRIKIGGLDLRSLNINEGEYKIVSLKEIENVFN